MKKVRMSVTEAARNFSECVNRARYQNVAFVLLKNGTAVARLIPEKPKTCTAGELAEVLAGLDLPEDEAKDWHRDLVAARKALKAPSDKWR